MIRLLVLDVDGTMTDGGVYYDATGNELKKFAIKDGAGLVLARTAGIRVMICTGRECEAVRRRAAPAQQPQQHQHAVAALCIGGGKPVVVNDGGVLIGAQVACQDQRAGVGGLLVKALGVGEERIVRLDKLRHKVGRDGHVSLCRRHWAEGRVGYEGETDE